MKLIARHLTVDMYGCKVKNLSDLDFIKKTNNSFGMSLYILFEKYRLF